MTDSSIKRFRNFKAEAEKNAATFEQDYASVMEAAHAARTSFAALRPKLGDASNAMDVLSWAWRNICISLTLLFVVHTAVGLYRYVAGWRKLKRRWRRFWHGNNNHDAAVSYEYGVPSVLPYVLEFRAVRHGPRAGRLKPRAYAARCIEWRTDAPTDDKSKRLRLFWHLVQFNADLTHTLLVDAEVVLWNMSGAAAPLAVATRKPRHKVASWRACDLPFVYAFRKQAPGIEIAHAAMMVDHAVACHEGMDWQGGVPRYDDGGNFSFNEDTTNDERIKDIKDGIESIYKII